MLNVISYSAQVIHEGGVIGEMRVTGGNVTWDINSKIKRSARISVDSFVPKKIYYPFEKDLVYPSSDTYPGYTLFLKTDDPSRQYYEFDMMRDQIRIVMNINGVESSLGTFYVCASPKTIESTGESFELELYEKTFVYDQSDLGERYFINKDLRYIDVIDTLLQSVGGQTLIIKEDCDLLFKEDREYTPDQNVLTVINELLTEIGYKELYFNELGYAVLEKNELIASISHRYIRNRSEIYSGVESNYDIYRIPNKFIGIISNPDVGYLTHVAINDDPHSKLSTVNRGMTIQKVYKLDGMANEAELVNYIERLCQESKYIYDTVTMYTSPEPGHGYGDRTVIIIDDIQGVYRETSWDITLSVEGKMSHRFERSI